MKKYSLLKILGLSFLAFVLLTWLVPNTHYSSGVATLGSTSPIGIFDIFRYPLLLFEAFVHYGLIFLAIGGFYGVINRTGVYSKIIDKIVSTWKNKEKWLLVTIIVSLSILSSISGLYLPLFILVPFLVTLIMSLGYNKITAFASTIGSIIIGMIGTTYGIYLTSVNFINDNNLKTQLFGSNGFLNLGINSYIIVRAVILIIVTFLFTILVIKKAKKEKNVEIPLYDNNKPLKKGISPLIIISSIMVLFIFVGMYTWEYTLGVDLFNNVYTSITSITIGDYSIVKNILGSSLGAFGYYGYYEMIALMIIFSLLIGWVYSIKFKDLIDSFIEGAKKMAKPALYAILANIIFIFGYIAIRYLVLYNSVDYSSGTISLTITRFILNLSTDFNVFTTTLATIIGSVFYNDIYFLSYELIEPITLITTTNLYPIVGVIVESVYGLMMMILPTSVILIASLSYMDVSYKDWIKYIWKYILEILAIIIIVAVIMLLLI